MSAQGVFILDGMDSRPKSKKQLKELVAKDPSQIAVEQVSMFGEQFEGRLSKEAIEEWGPITFVGPNPYSKRDFFGQFFLNGKGEVSVK